MNREMAEQTIKKLQEENRKLKDELKQTLYDFFHTRKELRKNESISEALSLLRYENSKLNEGVEKLKMALEHEWRRQGIFDNVDDFLK